MQYRLGIDFGGTGIKAGIVDENYRIIEKQSVPTRSNLGFSTVVSDMAKLAFDVCGAAGLSVSDCVSIGVGTPSFVNPKTDNVVYINNANFKNIPLRAELHRLLNRRVHICNDANCAVAGEMLCGAAKGLENVLMLTLGTGLGSGVMIRGRIFGGCDNMGAELGHTQFAFDGVRCTCGIPGCFEAYASVTALINQTRHMMEESPSSLMVSYTAERGGRVSGRTAFDCAKAGDAAAKRVVDTYIGYVAAGIGSFVNIFRPDVVLIGGGISNEGDYLIEPLNRSVPDYILSYELIGGPPVRAAALGNDAGIIGAAYLDMV